MLRVVTGEEGAPTIKHPLMVVTGARGGVGATTVSVNAAYLLAERYQINTCLIDSDAYFGTVALHLDITQNQGMAEALRSTERLDDVFIQRLAIKKTEHLRVLAAEHPLDEPLLWEAGAVDALLTTVRTTFRMNVLDLPHSHNSQMALVLPHTTHFAIVCELSIASLRDTARLLSLIHTMNSSIRTKLLLLNSPGPTMITRHQFEQEVGHPIDFVLPYDRRSTLTAINNGTVVAKQNNKLAKVLEEFVRA